MKRRTSGPMVGAIGLCIGAVLAGHACAGRDGVGARPGPPEVADTRAWVAAQNARSRSLLDAVALRTLIVERAGQLRRRPETTPPVRHDLVGREYFSVDGVLKRAGPPDEIVYQSFVGEGAISDFAVSPDGTKVAVGHTWVGDDWQTWRAFEISSKRVLTAPYTIKNLGGNSMVWDVDSQGLFYGEAPADDARGHARMVLKYHRLGTPKSEDRVIFRDPEVPPTARYQVRPVDAERVIVYRTLGAAEIPITASLVGRAADGRVTAPRPLMAPGKFWGRLVTASTREALFRTNEPGPRYGIVAVDLDTGARRVIVPARAAETLVSARALGDRLVLHYLTEDLDNVIRVVDRDGAERRELRMPELGMPGRGTLGTITGDETSKTTYFTYSGLTQASETFAMDLGTLTVRKLPDLAIPFDGGQVRGELRTFPSFDGQAVPIQVYTRADTSASAPLAFALLAQYGAIGAVTQPGFNVYYQLVLELGGMVAIVHPRGGGERGFDWHQAGRTDKRVTVDDIAAGARWLRATYAPKGNRVVIAGRSYGGTHAFALMVRHPDAADGFVPMFGLSDPEAFVYRESGWWAFDDLGFRRDDAGHLVADDAQARGILRSWNPMRHLPALREVKPVLMLTADNDTRVGSDQTYRMTRALQARFGEEAPVHMLAYRGGHSAAGTLAVDLPLWLVRLFDLTELRPLKP